MKVSVVKLAAGSAFVEIGNTRVICSVYGPRRIDRASEYSEKGKLWCDFKYSTNAIRFQKVARGQVWYTCRAVALSNRLFTA